LDLQLLFLVWLDLFFVFLNTVYIGGGSKTSYTRATPSAFHVFVNRPQGARAIHKNTKMLGS